MSEVIYEKENSIAWITLNRPDVLNALSPAMAKDLHVLMEDIKAQKDIRCVVIRGSGKGFMAGGDIEFFHSMLPELSAGNTEKLKPLFKHVHGIVNCIRMLPIPVIAGVHGAAAGLGLSLVAACDLAVAAQDTQFTLAYCHIGTSPDGASTYFLPRLMGIKQAMEMALLGERFDAERALSLGLINQVVPAQDLNAKVSAWAERIARGPTLAYGKTKHLLYASLDHDFFEQIRLEEESFAQCAQSVDFAEGITAFVQKRKPEFGLEKP